MKRWLLWTIVVFSFMLSEAHGVGIRRPRVTLDAQTMKAALRTETPEEKGYIDEVLRRVRLGQLPRSLVESTFLWARQKPEHRFQYFQRALRLQAARLGFAAP